ncbi:uncharacterized protein LOC129720032 [Wyeomyia smithii]|uniref:uncharacterized protein LOC129720032 n=1 Tax=Wyeomyia smithii TaxID=174621 RepID=UPI002467EBA7|nr:uncharacterized protein LOC129720032 [Wyeomyia smithii]
MKEESVAALHGLVDDFERHTKVLKQLGEPTEYWSTILEHLLCTRLHQETLKMWEDYASTFEFLQRRMRVLESISVNQDHKPFLPSFRDTPESYSESAMNQHMLWHSDNLQLSSHAVTDGAGPNGFSLNDALRVGPVLQDDLLSIILRFRTYPVAVAADIEKMYRQVLMQPCDVPYQKILWRFSSTKPIQEYELLTVTYGLAPSSFLATRTLQQLANDEGMRYPSAEPMLRKHFYVDDCLAGAQSIEEAIRLRDELIELLKKSGFALRKFAFNKLELLNGLSAEQIGTQSSLTFAAHEMVKTLGIGWEPERDTLQFNSSVKHSPGHVTKRSILSAISQLFDPLGLIAPIIIHGKLLMQELWLVHCEWDQPVPSCVETKWQRYYSDLPKIVDFRTPRFAFLPNASVQLHTFCDASESAYGACTYARSMDNSGNIRVQLLASKSRVAPLNRITLPRLELCAAKVGAQLHAHISNALQIKTCESRFWSDSMVTITSKHLENIRREPGFGDTSIDTWITMESHLRHR